MDQLKRRRGLNAEQEKPGSRATSASGTSIAGERRVNHFHRVGKSDNCVIKVSRSEAGAHGTATAAYLHREGAKQVDGTNVGQWPDRDRLVVSINPERVHFIEALGRDVVAELERRFGKFQHDLVLHADTPTERKHLHLVMQGPRADSIQSKDIKAAVEKAMDLRHERAVAWAKEQRIRERERPKTLEKALDAEMDRGIER